MSKAVRSGQSAAVDGRAFRSAPIRPTWSSPNGYRVWQRSIPIGGNHFTKALTKELKLTFAKAEHLKRNAMKAENPKAVFQAMRPVFSDLVAEIQRSIGFFTSNNRNAKLGDVVALGNPMKLPGLQRFLSQNLDQEVEPSTSSTSWSAAASTAGPQFKENQLTFGVAYGLCVQALEQVAASHESAAGRNHHDAAGRGEEAVGRGGCRVAVERHGDQLLRLLLCLAKCGLTDNSSPAMAGPLKRPKSRSEHPGGWRSQTALVAKFDEVTKIGQNLQSNVDGRLLWLELLKASTPRCRRTHVRSPNGRKRPKTSPRAKRFTFSRWTANTWMTSRLVHWHLAALRSSQESGANPAAAAKDAAAAAAATGDAAPRASRPPPMPPLPLRPPAPPRRRCRRGRCRPHRARLDH